MGAPADNDDMLPSNPGDRPRRFGLRLSRGLIGSALGLFVLVLLVLPVFSTLQPGYYGRYPELRERMNNWTVSTHGKTSCLACHVEPGASGFAGFAFRSIPAFYSQLATGPKSTNLLRPPSQRACQKCHTAYRKVSPDGDLLIPHRAHVEVLKMNCTVCHTDLVHAANDKGFNRPRMKPCLERCHDGVKATRECTKCHTHKKTPESHEQKDWLKVHSKMAETTDCGSCHSWTPDYCADCHAQRPASHKGNWKKDHAPHAKTRGDGCLVCHGGEKFCKKCH